MKKQTRIAIITITLIVALIGVMVGAFFIYASNYYEADETALEALKSNVNVNVSYNEDGDFYAFEPLSAYSSAFVFIPGGKVEYTAYAPLMQEIAKCGVLCILLKVNFNLAILDQNAPKGIQSYYPDVAKWSIGGHSLGGSVASMYLAKNPNEYSTIIFLASYPQSDLSSLNIKSVSIYGTKDGVMNRDKFEESKTKLPKESSIFEIEGANHAQFGSYGFQKGDNEATIENTVQWAITASYVIPFLSSLY